MRSPNTAPRSMSGSVPSRRAASLLYGCGSCDMKAGVAVALRLAARLARPAQDVTWVFYDCEEVEADRNGLLRVSRNRPGLLEGDLAVLIEPASGVIEGGCQGTLRAEVATHGRRAHSARACRAADALGQIVQERQGVIPDHEVENAGASRLGDQGLIDKSSHQDRRRVDAFAPDGLEQIEPVHV